jgi:hypothetical protein
VLRNLFRKGTTGLGKLAAQVRLLAEASPFKASLARLIEWKMVETSPAYHGGALRAELTETGKFWGMELACEAQLEEQYAAAKEFDDKVRADRAKR